MSALTRQWRNRPNFQPDYPVQLDPNNEFARNLIVATYITAQDAEKAPYNYVGNRASGTATNQTTIGGGSVYGNSSQWEGTYGTWLTGGSGVYPSGRIIAAPKWNGSTSISYLPLDLSTYDSLSMAFWARRNTAEVGKIGMEYGAGPATGDGWYFSVNAVDNSTINTGPEWGRYIHSGANNATICGNGNNPPAVGTWHHYVMNLDQTTTSWGGNGLSGNTGVGTDVNGREGNFVGSGNAIIGHFYANGGLYFGARAGLVVPSTLSICGLMIWSKFTTRAESRRLYNQGHWQMWKPRYSMFRAWPLQFTPPISGCTDPTALNYNPDATIDDGSCVYPPPPPPPPDGGGGGLPEPRPNHTEPEEIVCPVCGFRYPWDEFVERWDKLWVCTHGCWEPRHPLDLQYKYKERPPFKYYNPEPIRDVGPTYTLEPTPLYCDMYRGQGLSDIGIADCAKADIQL